MTALRKRLETAAQTVTLETAATKPGHISSRTILTRAGGTASLRKMAPTRAMTLVRKAASELVAERKEKGRPAKVDRQELIDWIKGNCTGGRSKPKEAKKPEPKKVVKKSTKPTYDIPEATVNRITELPDTKRNAVTKALGRKLGNALTSQQKIELHGLSEKARTTKTVDAAKKAYYRMMDKVKELIGDSPAINRIMSAAPFALSLAQGMSSVSDAPAKPAPKTPAKKS